jgi:3-dehydroquinate dehydratase/shikimate dehydrogenase
VYLPFRVDELGPFLQTADLLEVRGLSVTVPFKERALRHLARADQAVTGAGACNTLVREAGGWAGANTDVPGFLAPLEREAPALLAAGTRAAVVGAGGAARAVVHALRSRGLRVLVLNRTPARARALARRFGCEWGGLDRAGLERLREPCALIVQTTPVGLHGAGDPLQGYRFRGEELVYDLVYVPPLTPLLARAQAAGCRTIGGLAMLRAQAAAQFRLFTGRELPAEQRLQQ